MSEVAGGDDPCAERDGENCGDCDESVTPGARRASSAAKQRRQNVGLPNFAFARVRNARGDTFDFALAAERLQACTARRDVLAVLDALAVGRFAESYRSCDNFGALVGFRVHTLSVITVRNVRIARQTRWRTASAV